MTKITWWGHATATVEDSGVRILTDPVLTARLAHLHRRRGPLPGPEAVRADLVIVSHLHADHLHLPSLAMLPPGTRLVLPRGGAGLVRGLPLDVTEVDVGETVAVGAHLRVTAVPAVHDGSRRPGSRLRAPALGFLIHGSTTTYFAGDTALFAGMIDLDAHIDCALLPVGGWGPTLRGGHLDPAGAAQAAQLIRPRVAVPIHFGTLWPIGLSRVRPHLFDGAGPSFARHARQTAPAVEVRVLDPGEDTDLGALATGR